MLASLSTTHCEGFDLISSSGEATSRAMTAEGFFGEPPVVASSSFPLLSTTDREPKEGLGRASSSCLPVVGSSKMTVVPAALGSLYFASILHHSADFSSEVILLLARLRSY